MFAIYQIMLGWIGLENIYSSTSPSINIIKYENQGTPSYSKATTQATKIQKKMARRNIYIYSGVYNII